ncbi:MAG: sulfatase-like hydrolase/transferase [Massilibacteroides sp.]|nr:sulfatase-like hydrolase/transferase [Massilibacteroides sp.]
MFGKWGLGYPGSVSVPNKLGFDEMYGYNCQREAHDYYPDHLWHNGKKVEFPENYKFGRKTYSHDLIHKQALKFIRDNKDKPFFAMLTYTLPHAEINLPHDKVYKEYQAIFKEDGLKAKPTTVKDYYPSDRPHTSFASMVSRLDKGVGEVLAELKELGLDKNTLVIFTSDNGPHDEGGADPKFFNSNAQYRGIKRDLYEGGIREPMIAWAPDMIKGGSKTNLISAFWDVMPTLGELIEAKIPVATDGISFLPTLKGQPNQKKHDYMYWEFHGSTDKQAVRKGDWKLIRLGMGGKKGIWEELYNIKNDESETKDLYKSNPDKVKELEALMDQAHVDSPVFTLRK